MKSFYLFIAFLFTVVGIQGQTQATATFTASVTIIEPIGITTTSNMNFASLDAKEGGTIKLTPESKRFSSGSVQLAEGSTVSAATFRVTGEEGYSFAISLPQGEYLLSNGQENLFLRNITSNLGESGEIKPGGSEIRIGATLEIKAGQLPGTYRSPALPVTVNYN